MPDKKGQISFVSFSGTAVMIQIPVCSIFIVLPSNESQAIAVLAKSDKKLPRKCTVIEFSRK
jgi:hypothetical protein